MEISKKTCTKCKVEKLATVEFFYKNRNSIGSICKICKNKKQKEYELSNPHIVKERKHKYYLKNIDKIKKYQKEYSETHKEQIKNRLAKYCSDNFEARKIYRYHYNKINPNKKREYYLKNFDKTKDKRLRYNLENKHRINIYNTNSRVKLSDSYVSSTLRKSVKDIPKEVLETKRLIIQLKRELKQTN